MATTNIVVDETNIKQVIKALEDLSNNLQEYADEYTKKIVEEGKDYLDKQYSARYDKDNIQDINTSYEKITDGYELISRGKDVLYEEFGTGDMGEQKPHPDKSNSKYKLKPYNSGEYIRDVSDYDENSYTYDDLQSFGITSGKFWRYEKDGVIHYTQGVPAGQEMWNTRNHIITKVIPKVKKEMGAKIRGEFEKTVKR